jgi:hypothetical protein
VSNIPQESAPLEGLAQVNQEVVRELGWAEQKIATLDRAASALGTAWPSISASPASSRS